MTKTKLACLLVVFLALCSSTALAQNGNPCPGDKEYQFNIIGVPKQKNPDMTNNNGHRIFVNLDGHSKINMTGDTDPNTEGLQCGNKFDVLDANATGGGGEATILVPCDGPLSAGNLNPDVCFDVYATPLGGPGSAHVDVVCESEVIIEADCGLATLDFDLVRNSGKPVQQDITGAFRATGCVDLGGEEGVCDEGDIEFNNEWIFNVAELQSYYWDYDNDGLRLTQIRFCDVEGVEGSDCGPNTVVQ